MSGARAALFLDRDGTIIEDAHYLADPSGVRLMHGAAQAIALANEASVPVVVVTNQSGIARGMITTSQYDAVRARTNALLLAHGARVDATFHCPHTADGTDPTCDCRKPALGMYRQAEAHLHLDLAHSAYVGDRWRDVEPALKTGGLGVLVPSAETPHDDIVRARAEAFVHDNLSLAVEHALAWIAQQSTLATGNSQ